MEEKIDFKQLASSYDFTDESLAEFTERIWNMAIERLEETSGAEYWRNRADIAEKEAIKQTEQNADLQSRLIKLQAGIVTPLDVLEAHTNRVDQSRIDLEIQIETLRNDRILADLRNERTWRYHTEQMHKKHEEIVQLQKKLSKYE